MIEQMMRSLHPALCQKPEARTTALQNEFVSPDFARQAVSLRSRAQTFLKHLSEKVAAGELFRQAERPANRPGALIGIHIIPFGYPTP